jgi:hypothetical protein
MTAPTPRFESDSPVEVLAARPLFASEAIVHRMCASLIRLDTGRLLLTFRLGAGPARRNDGALMLTRSDDDGERWSEPLPIYAYPGWDCMNMGGLMRYADDRIVLVMGRLQLDLSLPGEEPCTGWHTSSTVSRDGGESWSPPGPEIRLFPTWTELYGASNPHLLEDGRHLLAVIGTAGRDEGWHSGTSFTDDLGQTYSSPVVIACAPDREYSDLDLVRLPDGRFLAVGREHIARHSVFSHSSDEGQSWTPLRPTGFMGANLKLTRLRSGAVLCSYRDEDPRRPGVSCSISEDGGESWRCVGQLYAATPGVSHERSSRCGYPDMVYTSPDELVAVVHPYPDDQGRVDLHLLRLRDRT